MLSWNEMKWKELSSYVAQKFKIQPQKVCCCFEPLELGGKIEWPFACEIGRLTHLG